jgi:hypothetical protein
MPRKAAAMRNKKTAVQLKAETVWHDQKAEFTIK